MNTKRLLFLGLMLSATFTFSQNVGINASGTAPENSAGLDVDFSNKGVLIPRVSLTALDESSPISSPATSLLVYNTETAGTGANQVTPGYYYWYASKWVRLYDGEEADGKYWRLDGNSATSSDFLGTTNNIALRFRTYNTDQLQITTSGMIQAFQDGTPGSPTYSFTTNSNMGMFRAGANQLGFSTGSAKRFHIENTFIQSVQNHRFANGTAASPSITFTSNTGTGLFRPGANILAFSTNEAERMRIQADGRTLVNTTSNTIPGTIPTATFRFLVRATGSESTAIAAYHTGTGPGLFVNARASTNNFSAVEILGNLTGTSSSGEQIGVQGYATGYTGYSIYSLTHPNAGVFGISGEYNAADGDYNVGDDIGVLGISGDGIGVYGWGIDNYWGVFSNGDLGVAGNAFANGVLLTSDKRFKRNITTYENMNILNKVMQLSPKYYQFKADEFPSMRFDENYHFGFIAQELKEIFPELVEDLSYKNKALTPTNKSTKSLNERTKRSNSESSEVIELDTSSDLKLAVNYIELIPILTQAIQEQQHIIDSQKERIEKLEEQVQMLMEKIK